MSTRRERFFRCRLLAGQGGEESILQAWDREAAAAAFREELTLAGLSSAGPVEVEDLTELARRGAALRSQGLPGAAAGA